MSNIQLAKTFTTKELAQGFNTGVRNLRKHVTENLVLNEDYYVGNSSSSDKTFFVYEKGVIKLSNLITSQKAKDFVAQITLQTSLTDPTNPLFWQKLQQQNQIAIQYLQNALNKEKENVLKLESENTQLANRDLEVKTKKEYKWKKQEIQNDRGRTINYYVNKIYSNISSYAERHRKAKQNYRQATGINLPEKAYLMTVDQKKDYLNYLASL